MSLITIPEKISTLLNVQFPEFIVENNPNFVAFLRAYYEWMERSDYGAVLYHSKKLLDYKDLDTTTEEFFKFFKNDFLPYFPEDVLLDERKLIRFAREFYSKKGSEESIKFLFRILYNKDIEIFYPKENILVASDGKWQIPQAIKVVLTPEYYNFDVSLLKKRGAFGSESNASCVIENVYRTYDAGLDSEVVELYISNLVKSFDVGEDLVINGTYANTASFTFSQKIIGSVSNLKILQGNTLEETRYNQGLGYRTGDPVVFYGGLAEDSLVARKAVAYVNNVSAGKIESVEVLSGGFGYSPYPNTIISVVSANGSGANLVIQSVNNVGPVRVNRDSIFYKASAALSDADYGFDNVAGSDITTTLLDAFTFYNVDLGSIYKVFVTNSGSGYTEKPLLLPDSTYETDLSVDLYNPSQTNGGDDYRGNVAHIRDLGRIANVKIISGGSGYNPSKDKIILNTAIGYGANISFTVDANGKIVTTNVVHQGEGFIFPIGGIPVSVVNSANIQIASTGSGASLIAYGYNEGENLNPITGDIGLIFDFKITDRGFDYISTPNVSLAIIDVETTEDCSLIQNLLEGGEAFQGDLSNNATTFLSYLDKSGSRRLLWQSGKANTIRIYNYTGDLNFDAPLSLNTAGGIVNVTVANTTVYGNGKAKAKVEFLNGVIRYDGFYLNTDGFLSSDMYLQNYTKYHNFSYVLQVEKSLNNYKDLLMQIAHPSGMEMLGLMVVSSNQKLPLNKPISQNITTIDDLTGNVTTNAFDPNAILYGDGTSFNSSATVGDLVVVASGLSGREQTKSVVSIISDTQLVMDGNTRFFGDGTLSSSAYNANVIISTDVSNRIKANDYISFNVGEIIGMEFYSQNVESNIIEFYANSDVNFGIEFYKSNTYTAKVEYVNHNIIKLAVPDNMFIFNVAATPYYVYPRLEKVNYQIIHT